MIVLSHRSGSSLQRSSFHRSAQKPLTKMISLHQTAEQAKMRNQLVAQFMPFFPLIARILMFCDKKYRMLRICDKKYCILTSGSVWLSMARCPAHSGPLWLSVARSPALSGSLWLPLAPSGSLWLSIALQICLKSPYLARKALAQLEAAILRYMTFYRSAKQ